ncbi:MAG: hypothetical protein J6L59_00105 [Clostridia bacterium]|nr:hypothetical protein [Clostridia bacterium]
MKLNFEQIKSITKGVVNVEFDNGKYKFFRFTAEESKSIENQNFLATAGVQMMFKTDGKKLKLKIFTQHAMPIRSYFSLDVLADGVYIGSIKNFDDDTAKGNYAEREYPLGSFNGEFNLGEGEKSVKIVFPHSVIAYLEEIEIENATYVTPIKKEKTIVFYGDSITQGFEALHASKTYAARLAESLDAETINKGLGGAVFCPKLAFAAPDVKADLVVVAYGTNDWYALEQAQIRKNAEEFLTVIKKKFAHVPVYVLTPIWRFDWLSEKKGGKVFEIIDIIYDVFQNNENMHIICGTDLVPHDETLFGDLRLHPSDDGFEHYFKNLLKEINC